MAIASSVLLLSVLLARGQDPSESRSITIPKQDRSVYIPVLERYREAEAVLPTDPLECAKRCTELIDDKSLKENSREARLRVQNTDGSYGEWTSFVPFQLRGLAWMARAQAVALRDRPEAAEAARKAVADLEESLRRGMRTSGPYLEKAREVAAGFKDSPAPVDPRLAEAEIRIKELRQLRDGKAAPEVLLKKCEASTAALTGTVYEGDWRFIRTNAFEARWMEHVKSARFRSAMNVLTDQGGFLAEEDRKKARSRIEDLCRDHVVAAVNDFRSELRDVLSPGQAWLTLGRLTPTEFSRRFLLPEAGELVLSPPDLEWGRRCTERLLRIRSVADPVAAPLSEFKKILSEATQASVDAAHSVPRGENRAVVSLETLAWELARSRLEKAVEGASEAAPEQLRVRRDEVAVLAAEFEDFGVRLEKELSGWDDQGAAFRVQHPSIHLHAEQIRAFRTRLPVDLEKIDDIGKALFDPSNPRGLWGKSPQLALEFEKELQGLEQSEGNRLSLESRRKLGTCLLVAGISRLLYSGLEEGEIAKQAELQKIGRWLGSSGGPVAEMMTRVSPRVLGVMDRLKP